MAATATAPAPTGAAAPTTAAPTTNTAATSTPKGGADVSGKGSDAKGKLSEKASRGLQAAGKILQKYGELRSGSQPSEDTEPIDWTKFGGDENEDNTPKEDTKPVTDGPVETDTPPSDKKTKDYASIRNKEKNNLNKKLSNGKELIDRIATLGQKFNDQKNKAQVENAKRFEAQKAEREKKIEANKRKQEWQDRQGTLGQALNGPQPIPGATPGPTSNGFGRTV